jgi:hypothetical protein
MSDGAARRIARDRLLARVAIGLLAAGCLAGIAVPAGLGWDFANFYDAGRRVLAGQIGDLYDPDSLIAGRPPQGTTGFFGAPLSALFYVPIGALAPETALVLFKIQNVVAFAITFLVLYRFCSPFAGATAEAQARFAAMFFGLCVIYQPFWTVFRVGGQTTPTVLMLFTLGLIAHVAGRFWWSSACLVIAVLIKPAFVTAVALIAIVSGVAFFWRIAVTGAVAGAVSVIVMGWPIHAAFLDLMQRAGQITYAWYFNSSIYVLADNLRIYARHALGPDAMRVELLLLTAALRLTVAATVVWLLVRSRRESWTPAAHRHFRYMLAVIFFLLWSATIWEHYLSLLFLPLIYIVATRRHMSRAAMTAVAVIFVLSIGQNLILVNWVRYGFDIDSLPELLAVALVKCGPLLVTLVLLWRHRRELFRTYDDPAWTRALSP